jgi:glycosyltransferase involved in cell wall biosynthesis
LSDAAIPMLLLDFRAHSPSGIERYAALTAARLVAHSFAGWRITALAFADQRPRLDAALEQLNCNVRTVERPLSVPFADVRGLVDLAQFDHVHFWHPLSVRVLSSPFSSTLYDDLRVRLPQLNESHAGADHPVALAAEYEQALLAAGVTVAVSPDADDVGRFHRLNLAFSAHHSSFNVACSGWAARTLAALTGTGPSKWVVLTPRAEDVAAIWRSVPARSPAGLPCRPFVLHVGGVTAHHRPDLVWPALAQTTYVQHELIIVGKDWGRAGTTDFGRAPVTRLVEVDDGELRWLYQHCAALLVASVREGFCLPVAEAAAHGRPVVHTRTAGIAEALALAGDARPLTDDLDEAVRTSVRLEDW